MFKKSLHSFVAVCAASMFLPMAVNAGSMGSKHSYHSYKYLGGKHSNHQTNRTVVGLSNGTQVTTKGGTQVTTKWARGFDEGCGCGEAKPMMSDPYYIFFAHDSSAISGEAHSEIKRAYHDAMHHGATKFKLSGHASTPGSQDYNMKLSSKRVSAVSHKLMSMGVADHKIMTASFGETVPFDKHSGKSHAAKDRRVEIRYVYGDK